MRLDLKVSHEERAELVWCTLELLGLSKVAHYSCDKASKQQLSMCQSAPHGRVTARLLLHLLGARQAALQAAQHSESEEGLLGTWPAPPRPLELARSKVPLSTSLTMQEALWRTDAPRWHRRRARHTPVRVDAR